MTPPFKVVADERVPMGEVWFYAREPVEIQMPPWLYEGKSFLREPDAKIVNVGVDNEER
jgi:hypothetical protein